MELALQKFWQYSNPLQLASIFDDSTFDSHVADFFINSLVQKTEIMNKSRMVEALSRQEVYNKEYQYNKMRNFRVFLQD